MTQTTIHSHIHTTGQFKLNNEPDEPILHDTGLWEWPGLPERPPLTTGDQTGVDFDKICEH